MLGDFQDLAGDKLRVGMHKALLHLAGQAAKYPPAPSGSTYRRTGTLGRRWTNSQPTIEFGGSGAFVAGRIGNNTVYGPWVQGADKQAAVHRGRWDTTDQILAKNQQAVKGILDDAGGGIVATIAEEVEG